MNGIEQQAMPIQAVSFLHVQGIHSVNCKLNEHLLKLFSVTLTILLIQIYLRLF